VETRKDASGHVTTYTYDRRGLLRVTNAPEGVTTLSTPDSMGDPVELTDGEGRVTVSKNDHRRRQAFVTNPVGETTRFGYDLNNNLPPPV
jgi:YD repeat-containing protein